MMRSGQGRTTTGGGVTTTEVDGDGTTVLDRTTNVDGTTNLDREESESSKNKTEKL